MNPIRNLVFTNEFLKWGQKTMNNLPKISNGARKILFFLIPLIVFGFYLAGDVKAVCVPGHTDNGDGTCTATWQVGQSSDDTEYVAGYTPVPYWSFAYPRVIAGSGAVGSDRNRYGGGMRFTNIAIPQGATIIAANLTFRCNVSENNNTVNTKISAEDVDDAPTFADSASAFVNRYNTHTTAMVNWDSIPAWTAGNDYDSPDIKTVIQEVIDRSGWSSGNDMVLFWEDYDNRSTANNNANRWVYSYDGSSVYAPKLELTYTIPSAPTVTNSTGASQITNITARLNGEVTDTGGKNPTVYIYWGDNDGGTTAGNWDNTVNLGTKGAETFYTDISGLTPGRTYYYRSYAVNSAGSDWADSTESFATTNPTPCQNHNVSGWAWSNMQDPVTPEDESSIGWISFSCENLDNPSDYGVDIDATGNFSGYAYFDINDPDTPVDETGWIYFAPAGPYPSNPNYSAKMDTDTGRVSGWARVCSVFQSGCSGELRSNLERGGWDGWIKLRKGPSDSGPDYGVSVDAGTGEFSGYAWSDMVIGWINFQGVNYKVTTDFSFNQPPDDPVDLTDTWNNCGYKGKSLPVLSWSEFTDEDGDEQAGYEIQIDSDASLPNDPPGQGEFREVSTIAGNSYTPAYRAEEWADWMDWDKQYWWVVRVKDDQGNWSEWSVKKFDKKSPKHAYPWPAFDWSPSEPNQGEVIVFDPDESETYDGILSYFWTITEGDGAFIDDTSQSSQYPHIVFSTAENKIKLQLTDTDGYACESKPAGGTLIEAQLPLPEYREVPPVSWFRKMLAALIDPVRNLQWFNGLKFLLPTSI